MPNLECCLANRARGPDYLYAVYFRILRQTAKRSFGHKTDVHVKCTMPSLDDDIIQRYVECRNNPEWVSDKSEGLEHIVVT